MKTASFTSTVTHNRCPRRFFFRYLHHLHEKDHQRIQDIRQLGSLINHSQLLGHLVHQALASAITTVIDEGLSEGDKHKIKSHLLDRYDSIITKSLSAGSNRLGSKDLQVVEIFHGNPTKISFPDGNILLEHFFEKGMELITLFGIRPGDTVETEIEDSLPTQRGAFRIRVDLLIRRQNQILCIDWKTGEEFTKEDHHQVRLYLEWARRRYRVSPTQLIGLLASLRTGHTKKVLFDVFDPISFSGGVQGPSEIQNPILKEETYSQGTENILDRYPPRPSPLTCFSCPYATECSESAVLPASNTRPN